MRGHLNQHYLIALGSNVPHQVHGRPARVLAASLAELAALGIEVLAWSGVTTALPLGPSRRRYANGAAVIAADLGPEELLETLKQVERGFGRRGRGQRWTARVLDLDIILWSGGNYASPELVIPHPAFRNRRFVLGPARAIAGNWRDPVTGLTIKQLQARLTRPRAAPRWTAGVGALSSVGRATDF